MANYLTKLISYTTSRIEDSDSQEQTHFEHIPKQIDEKNAERKKTLVDIARKAELLLL